MRCKWQKFYSRRYFNLSLKPLLAVYLAGLTLLPTASYGVMTITPVNGGSLSKAVPINQGILNLYYYVGPAPVVGTDPFFLDPGVVPLNVAKGIKSSGANQESNLQNAISLQIQSTSLQSGSGGLGNQYYVVSLQVGNRPVPIAGVGGTPCMPYTGGVGNCIAYAQNLNPTPSAPVPANEYFYAGRFLGNGDTIQFYPADVCKDLQNSSVTAAGCQNGQVDINSASTAVALIPIKITIHSVSNLNQLTVPSGSVDATPNTVNFSFQSVASTFTCPSQLSSVQILPQDQRVYVQGSQFTISNPTQSGAAPGFNLIVLGQDLGNGSIVKPLVLDNTFRTQNDVVSIGEYGSDLYFASGFKNSDATTEHQYQLAFLIQDAAGVYLTPDNSGVSSGLVCDDYGPIKTSEIAGFLPANAKCFIATAAFGSQDVAPVMLLRKFRDQVLLQLNWGEAFVEWYYSWSPQGADWLRDHPAMRIPVLIPLFYLELLAWVCLHPGFALIWFGFSLSVVMRVRGRVNAA